MLLWAVTCAKNTDRGETERAIIGKACLNGKLGAEGGGRGTLNR